MTRTRVQTQEELKEAFRIRTEVFVQEQGVSPEIEIDEHEEAASHVIVSYDGRPVGAGRVRQVEDVAKLERICVLAPYRKHQAGAAIMAELESIARERGLGKAKLHAQTQAAGFYSKLGYAADGEEFMEDGIPHIRMIKKLD
ncbi:GNAT family N-acetyltransferase [Paenibacillus sp. PL2-23]|uniref:GNAT family N-acetyltransferase n=1 Tax=Paenibacillus sp. PL2-23 TaxID=2100729 RepID=UPI0030FB4A20